MRADWTASGACTSGSIARPLGATRRGRGGAATTSTARTDKEICDEDPTDRLAAGVGGRAPAAAREGEGADPLPGRHGRRAPANAVARRGEGVRVRRAPGQVEPARPVRGPPSADR